MEVGVRYCEWADSDRKVVDFVKLNECVGTLFSRDSRPEPLTGLRGSAAMTAR